MNTILYLLLLCAEAFIDVLFMMGLAESMFYVPIAVAALVAVLLAWQILKLTKAATPQLKKKAMRNIALVMTVPVVAYFVTYIVTAVMFVAATV